MPSKAPFQYPLCGLSHRQMDDFSAVLTSPGMILHRGLLGDHPICHKKTRPQKANPLVIPLEKLEIRNKNWRAWLPFL